MNNNKTKAPVVTSPNEILCSLDGTFTAAGRCFGGGLRLAMAGGITTTVVAGVEMLNTSSKRFRIENNNTQKELINIDCGEELGNRTANNF
jgi:hypothetical protein